MPRTPKQAPDPAKPAKVRGDLATRFKPGNKAAVGRGQPTAVLIAKAFDEAILNITNKDRKIAHARLSRIDPQLADEMFNPTTDPQTARIHMIEKLAQMAQFDKTAAKILWDRYMPKPKMPLVNLDPEVAKMPPDQAAAIVAEKVAAGEIAPDTGDALIRVFSGAATIREAEANARLMNAMAEEEEKLNG